MAKDDILDAIGSTGPKINPFKYPQVKCDKCGHNVFRPGYVVYSIPGISLGMGTKDVEYPFGVYVCDKCGEIMKSYRDEMEEMSKNTEEKKSSLII